MTSQQLPLSSPRFQFDENNPFSGDMFKRKELADLLTGYLERLRDGAVIGIDAQWGEGKSWFGRNWAADLKAKNYRVIYLDAFQHDYFEDPFLLISSEINQMIALDDTFAEDLKGKAARVMKAILPLGTKALINIAGRLTLGAVDVSKDIEDALKNAADGTADATQKWLENKIEDHDKEKESLESFRDALKSFCESQDKPVIFFIDELDRCRPSFAVKLIERLKHFFDVPNLMFILLLNREQLEKAIKGVYGPETDATAYLGKFIHLQLRLPKNIEATNGQSNANWKYLWSLADHYKFNKTQDLEQFISSLSVFAVNMNMSLRDLEKAMTLLALNGLGNSAIYLAWPVALKLKHPSIFNGLLRADTNAHKDAVELLQNMSASENCHFWAKDYFLLLHISKGFGMDKLTDLQVEDMKRYSPQGYYSLNDPLHFWLRRLDLVSQE